MENRSIERFYSILIILSMCKHHLWCGFRLIMGIGTRRGSWSGSDRPPSVGWRTFQGTHVFKYEAWAQAAGMAGHGAAMCAMGAHGASAACRCSCKGASGI